METKPICYVAVADSKSDRETWLKARRLGIGSSDAPAILGVSQFRGPLAVYAEKIGVQEDKEATEAMEWGLLLEPLIIRKFAKETGREGIPERALLSNIERPWMMATLDATQLAADQAELGILEIKATGHRVSSWDEGIPADVFVQVQHQFAVTGLQWGSVAVLQRGCALKYADVERNDAFIAGTLLPALEEFWTRVKNQEPVDPDGSESARDALKALYPQDSGRIITLPGEFIDLDRERQRLDEVIGEAEKRHELLTQRIKIAMGDASEAHLPNGVAFTYRTTERKGYTVKPTTVRTLRRKAA